MKKILLFDFDGVIHSYKSGWQGATKIPDPPVKGILELLTSLVLGDEFDVCIYSSRSSQFGGRKAMKNWLAQQIYNEIIKIGENGHDEKWRFNILHLHQSMDPVEEHCSDAADKFVKMISFPQKKPAAYLTIDDRAICFDGQVSTLLDKIKSFKPWYKKSTSIK